MGRAGLEPATYGLKSPGEIGTATLEKGSDESESPLSVRVVYASQRVTPDMASGAGSHPPWTRPQAMGLDAEPGGARELTCVELLRAAARGDETETRALGVKLAAEVMAAPKVVLAHEVLASGTRATAKAVELAKRVLQEADTDPAASKVTSN